MAVTVNTLMVDLEQMQMAVLEQRVIDAVLETNKYASPQLERLWSQLTWQCFLQ